MMLIDSCRLLNGWRKNYRGQSVRTESNDLVAFATVSEDKEDSKKSRKMKQLTCFRCKKVGHYAIKCNEELPDKTTKTESNMLITDENSSVDLNQGSDDEDQEPEQYEESKNTKQVESGQTYQENGSTHDDDSTDMDTENDM